MTVLDIGANIGYYTLLEAARVGPAGKVLAVEPVPANMEILRHNVISNGYTNVSFFNYAVGHEEKEGTFYLARESNWGSMMPVVWGTGDTISVQVISIDVLVAMERLRSLDLIRMDIEGYETVAVRGMECTLAEHGPDLLVELHPNIIGGKPIVELLRQLGALSYGVRAVVDRSRDAPWRARGVHVERPALQELMHDERILLQGRPLLVWLTRSTHPG